MKNYCCIMYQVSTISTFPILKTNVNEWWQQYFTILCMYVCHYYETYFQDSMWRLQNTKTSVSPCGTSVVKTKSGRCGGITSRTHRSVLIPFNYCFCKYFSYKSSIKFDIHCYRQKKKNYGMREGVRSRIIAVMSGINTKSCLYRIIKSSINILNLLYVMLHMKLAMAGILCRLAVLCES